MDTAEVRYAQVGDARVAYQAVGEGPDVIYFTGVVSNLDRIWEDPSLARFHRRVASFSRLILFDRRGTGLSDPLPPGAAPTWEFFVDDVRAVLDDLGCRRAFIFAVLDAGATGILFAAMHPDRTEGLILANTSARFVEDEGYPAGLPRDVAAGILGAIEERWGTEELVGLAVPSRAQDPSFVRWYAKLQRSSTKPRDAAAWFRAQLELDVRASLPSVQVPALVLHSNFLQIPRAQGRYIAETLPNARFVETPGMDGVVWTDSADVVLSEVQAFVTGARRAPSADRVLATVLMTDIVSSTERAASLGDRRWREILRSHDEAVRAAVDAFRGRYIKSTGDGVLATFDGPSRAIACAAEIRERVRRLDISVRAGLHTGEIELLGDDVGGIAVHITARVMGEAGPDQILATRTVRDLVAGSDVTFEDRGTRQFKGVPEEWAIFEAVG